MRRSRPPSSTGTRPASGSDGRRNWIHVTCTKRTRQFRLGESRGDGRADATGISVHDFWKPYRKILEPRQAHCVAHLLRALDPRTEFHGEEGAAPRKQLLRGAVHEIHEAARAEGLRSADAADRIERPSDEIVAAALAWHDARPPPESRAGIPRRKAAPEDAGNARAGISPGGGPIERGFCGARGVRPFHRPTDEP